MEDEEWTKMMDHLQRYVPYLDKFIAMLKDSKRRDYGVLQQLEGLSSMITDRTKKEKLDTLRKYENKIIEILKILDKRETTTAEVTVKTKTTAEEEIEIVGKEKDTNEEVQNEADEGDKEEQENKENEKLPITSKISLRILKRYCGQKKKKKQKVIQSKQTQKILKVNINNKKNTNRMVKYCAKLEDNSIEPVQERTKFRHRNIKMSELPEECKCRTELDILQEYIKEISISDAVLTTGGKRLQAASILHSLEREVRSDNLNPQGVTKQREFLKLLGLMPKEDSVSKNESLEMTRSRAKTMNRRKRCVDIEGTTSDSNSFSPIKRTVSKGNLKSRLNYTENTNEELPPPTSEPEQKPTKQEEAQTNSIQKVSVGKNAEKRKIGGQNEPLLQEDNECDVEIIEPDRNYYFHLQDKYKCKLCPVKAKMIVQHYKKKHAEYEVLISRIAPDNAIAAIEESIENGYEDMKVTDIWETKYRRKKFTYRCRFCQEFFKSENSENFFNHLTGHTGEYRYICSFCPFQTANNNSLRTHLHSAHKGKGSLKPTYPAPPNFDIVFGYICAECNFIQMDKFAVKIHVQINHLGENKMIYKINMSTIVCKPTDVQEEKTLAEVGEGVRKIQVGIAEKHQQLQSEDVKEVVKEDLSVFKPNTEYAQGDIQLEQQEHENMREMNKTIIPVKEILVDSTADSITGSLKTNFLLELQKDEVLEDTHSFPFYISDVTTLKPEKEQALNTPEVAPSTATVKKVLSTVIVTNSVAGAGGITTMSSPTTSPMAIPFPMQGTSESDFVLPITCPVGESSSPSPVPVKPIALALTPKLASPDKALMEHIKLHSVEDSKYITPSARFKITLASTSKELTINKNPIVISESPKAAPHSNEKRPVTLYKDQKGTENDVKIIEDSDDETADVLKDVNSGQALPNMLVNTVRAASAVHNKFSLSLATAETKGTTNCIIVQPETEAETILGEPLVDMTATSPDKSTAEECDFLRLALDLCSIITEVNSSDASTEAKLDSMSNFRYSDDEEVSFPVEYMTKKQGLVGRDLNRCVSCGAGYERTWHFREHVSNCVSVNKIATPMPFKCYHCVKSFKSCNSLIDHIQLHGRSRFACSICDFKHQHQFYVESHIKTDHGVTHVPTTTPVDPKKCNYYEDEFIVGPKLQGQKSTDSGPGISSNSSSASDDVNKQKNKKLLDQMTNLAPSSYTETPVACKIEKKEKAGLSEEEEAQLLEFVPATKRYACGVSYCYQSCLEESALRHHLQAVHSDESEYRCQHCSKRLPSEENLISVDNIIKHLRLHEIKQEPEEPQQAQYEEKAREVTPWFCRMCKYWCNAEQEIITHVRDKHDLNTQQNTDVMHAYYQLNIDELIAEKVEERTKSLRPEEENAVMMSVEILEKIDVSVLRNTELSGTYGRYGKPFKKQFVCPFCEVFKNEQTEAFTYHLYQELHYTRYVCSSCGLTGITYEFLQRHSARMHNNKPETIHPLPPDSKIEDWVQKVLLVQRRLISDDESLSSGTTPGEQIKSEDVVDNNRSCPLQSAVKEQLKAASLNSSGYNTVGEIISTPDLSSTFDADSSTRKGKHQCQHCRYNCKTTSDMQCDVEGITNCEVIEHSKRAHRGIEASAIAVPTPSTSTIKPVMRKRKYSMCHWGLSSSSDEVQAKQPALKTRQDPVSLDIEELFDEASNKPKHYICEYCSMEFDVRQEIVNHHKAAHSHLELDLAHGFTLQYFQCCYCPYRNSYLPLLRHHQKKEHPDMEFKYKLVQKAKQL